MGAIGDDGVTGVTGAAGVTGVTGPAGEAGATGATGASGLVGASGVTGDTGATGAIGPTGTTGEPGAEGVTGPVGSTGATGQDGPSGMTGPTGPQGGPGSSIVTRIRSAGVVTLHHTTGEEHGPVTDIPLTGGTWTQGAEEINQVVGTVTVSHPEAFPCRGESSLTLTVDLEGAVYASQVLGEEEETRAGAHSYWLHYVRPPHEGLAETEPPGSGDRAPFGEILPEPGTSTGHTITAQASVYTYEREHSCTTSEAFKIDAVSIDVIGIH
jgi:hypothetical protein